MTPFPTLAELLTVVFTIVTLTLTTIPSPVNGKLAKPFVPQNRGIHPLLHSSPSSVTKFSRSIPSKRREVSPETQSNHLKRERFDPHRRRGSLSRRGSSSSEEIELDFDTLAIQIEINGLPYNYTLQANSDILIGYNAGDDVNAWDPTKDPLATADGPPIANDYHKNAQVYTVSNMSVGETTLNEFHVMYEQYVSNSQPGDPVGDIGFGLSGSRGKDTSSATSFLDAIYRAQAWALPIFSVGYGMGSSGSPAKLVLGAEIPGPKGDPTVWTRSRTDRWALPINISGHTGVADLATNMYWIVTPPDVAKDLISKAGLTESLDDQGNIIARYNCSTPPKRNLILRFPRIRLEIDRGSAGSPDSDGVMCQYLIKGIEQKEYPYPFTIGLSVFSLFNIMFDFTPDRPRVGFGTLVAGGA